MGRYYETAKPTFVDDVIYQAPYELIARALESKDLQVEEDEAEIDEVGVLSDDKQYTEQDKEKRNQVVNGYRTEIDNIAKKIQENPEHRNYYMRRIDTARKKFDKDISTGFLNDADQNFTLREAARKQILDRTDINEKQRITALNQLDFKFKGSDSEEEGGNRYSENLHIYEALDEEDFIKDKKAILRANAVTTNKNRTDGRYFTDESGVRKFIDNDRLDKTFESSTGVAKWEKALLQRLDRELDQGIIKTDEERDKIFNEDRAKFKKDFIASLEFEETTTTDKKSVDGTNRADAANSRAAQKHKKDMEEVEQKGKVLIDRDIIPVPEDGQTEEDKESVKYNKAGKKLKDDILGKLRATGNYVIPPTDNFKPEEAPQENTKALEEAANIEYDKILNTLNLPLEQRREAQKDLITIYGKVAVNNLLNFTSNKEEVYNSETMTSEEKKTFKKQTYATIPSDLVGSVTMPDGTTVNMTRTEFEKKAEQLIPTKKKVKRKLFVTIEGKKYAAFKSGKDLIPISTEDKEKVLLSKYDPNTNYQGGNKAGTETVEEIVGVVKPFNIKDMNLSTTKKYKYSNPLSEPVPTEKLNIHVKTSEGPMIFRINKPKTNQYSE
jgi:hypothetical protein